MEWTDCHNILLCREILLVEPFKAKQRTQQCGELWQSVAEHLNDISEPKFGDLQKAFLQVRVREAERDALRFHWIVDLQSTEIETLRFTRVVFGLAPSPFLLNGVIQQHLESMESRYPESVMEVRKSLYVDDLISGRSTKEEAKQLKCDAVEIFDEAKFKLHKWHSNVPELETNCDNGVPSYAK